VDQQDYIVSAAATTNQPTNQPASHQPASQPADAAYVTSRTIGALGAPGHSAMSTYYYTVVSLPRDFVKIVQIS
jgi:hypothetical protein